MIIDCHSFASVPLPYEPDQTEHRPDFCIGADPFHTPPIIRDVLVGAIEAEGYTVAIDAPFSRALVPLSVYWKDRRVSSVMIEVNRYLYMDERSGSRNPASAEVRALVERLILTLRHKKFDTTMKYIRVGQLYKKNAAGMAGL